ncbi:MAG: sigma 54-interacting transcriptional regulator [Firmicutes bacterium]|nr:sigma 54-interacting transcriptional regulator [Bacillota bacterium]
MNQVVTIERISSKLSHALEEGICKDPDKCQVFLKDVLKDLTAFLNDGIDFKAVVNSLDDSILITDEESRVIYTNPNYEVNTGIDPALLIGRKISDIVCEGKLFTGGAVMDVLRTGKKAFRLSDVRLTNPPQTGYVIGVPIFNEEGVLKQVVASSRPILTLKALKDDFEQFLAEANALKEDMNIKVLSNISAPSLKSTKLIGNSPILKHIWNTIQSVAPTDATILITGESGVGKEVVADEVYRMSNRNGKPFIKVNCASIPLNLLESELFGYEKGAFSGANTAGKQGLFEMANGGTLLMDEIGDMPMDLQVKLLRAIQNQEVTRVGGTKSIPLDIRFIAATNSNLKKKILEGTFRQDLYYRLNVIPLHIPPLRERKTDIPLICKHFIDLYGKKYHRYIKFNEQNYEVLMSYNWPGNIRELENIIEYLTICAPDSSNGAIDDIYLKGILNIAQEDECAYISGEMNELEVSKEDFYTYGEPLEKSSIDANREERTESIGITLTESLESYEKSLIETVLKNSRSLRDAGAKLGVNASTISRKIKQYGIQYPPANGRNH